MKSKIFLSAFCGVLFALPASFIYTFIIPEEAFMLSVATGLLFGLLLFPFLVIHERLMNKKYSEFESAIMSPIFYKANGIFNLGNKTRNGNIYFCESGILFASLDEKPIAVEELLLQNVEKYEFDNIHMNIYSTDGRKFIITTADAPKVLKTLKERGWVV